RARLNRWDRFRRGHSGHGGVRGGVGLIRVGDDNFMLLWFPVRPRLERERRPAAGLVAGFDAVPEANECVDGKWRRSVLAVEIQRETGRSGVEREVHLLRIYGDDARRFRFVAGHGKGDAILRVALEVVTGGRDGK